jgi:hypothetical protein
MKLYDRISTNEATATHALERLFNAGLISDGYGVRLGSRIVATTLAHDPETSLTETQIAVWSVVDYTPHTFLASVATYKEITELGVSNV